MRQGGRVFLSKDGKVQSEHRLDPHAQKKAPAEADVKMAHGYVRGSGAKFNAATKAAGRELANGELPKPAEKPAAVTTNPGGKTP